MVRIVAPEKECDIIYALTIYNEVTNLSTGYNIYITFSSIHDVLAMEKALKNFGIPDFAYKIIPTPRSISKSCGSCIKTDEKNKKQILEVASLADISVSGIYMMEE